MSNLRSNHRSVLAFFRDEEEDGFRRDVHDREKINFKTANRMKSLLDDRLANPSYVSQLRSGKVEAVIKITSSGFGKTSVKRLADYIARDISEKDAEKLLPEEVLEKGVHNERLDIELDTGHILSSKFQRDAVIEEWSADFKAKESYERQAWKKEKLDELKEEKDSLMIKDYMGGLSEKEDKRLVDVNAMIKGQYYESAGKRYSLKVYAPKDTVHMVLSVGGQHDEKGRFRAKKAVREYLAKNYGEVGYRYMFVEHNDTDNLHYHVILKGANELTGKQLSFDKADLFIQRGEFAQELEKQGIERSATLRRDRQQVLEKVEKGVEQLHERQSWYQNSLEKSDSGRSNNVFKMKSQSLKQIRYLDKVLAREGGRLFTPSDKVVSLKEVRQKLKRIEQDIKEGSAEQLRAEFKETFGRLRADQGLIAEKLERIDGEYNRKRKERYTERVKELLGQHKKDINQALVYYKEQGGRDLEVISTLQRLDANANRIMRGERKVELTSDSVSWEFKMGHIKDVQKSIERGENPMLVIQGPLSELKDQRKELESELKFLLRKSKREPFEEKLKDIVPKEEWLRDVLLPSIETYQENTTGISLEAVVQSKEQEVSIVKEKQQMAKEQSLQKEKTKSLDRDKGLGVE
jgi:hypothetical protein